MVYFIDEVIGNITTILKQKGMWENTVLTLIVSFFMTIVHLISLMHLRVTTEVPALQVWLTLGDDYEIMMCHHTGSKHTGNNWPLRGTKMTNWFGLTSCCIMSNKL